MWLIECHLLFFRKITELSRSIDERLEMVSMSINGFLESCVRIQDNQPMIEVRLCWHSPENIIPIIFFWSENYI